MRKTIIDILIIAIVSIFSSVVIIGLFKVFPPTNLEKHVPHGFNEILERNYDGPLYVIIAKLGYNPKLLDEINFNGLKAQYYPSHFPLYPMAIRMVGNVIGDYFRASIAINWLAAFFATAVFYLILKEIKVGHPLWLSLLSLFLPARWLAVRSVGASEGMFIMFFLLLALFWLKKRYLIAGIFGALMILTRPPGVLFIPPLIFMAFYQKLSIKQAWPILLLPLALIGLFLFYGHQYGDFLIFIHNTSGTNSLLHLIPFLSTTGYIGPVAEGFLLLYMVYFGGIYLLWKEQKLLAILCSVYLLSTVFIKTDDVWRELIPISPFVIVLGYHKFLTTRYFLILFIPILLGTYIYTTSLLPRRLFNYDDYAKLRMSTVSPIK